jgi:hypothetical protein
MRSEQLREAIERLETILHESERLAQLLNTLEFDAQPVLRTAKLLRLLEALRKLRNAEQVHLALAQVDFQDDHYSFIRAIDGDTIVVAPPAQLQRWMKDIHIRLYGLETPELWEGAGEQYRQHLEQLCSDDGSGRLMIVWERKRKGTDYEGFPLSSFERGIGHVFFSDRRGGFYYVNALMHLLRFSSLKRDDRLLLRGRHHLDDIPLPWTGACATPLELDGERVSETFREAQSLHPPVCLLRYSKLPTLDPRDPRFAEVLTDALIGGWNHGCPFSAPLVEQGKRFLKHAVNQRLSPFDLPLLLISRWAAEHHIELP